MIMGQARRASPLSVRDRLTAAENDVEFRGNFQEETMIRGVHTMFYSSEPEALRPSSGTSWAFVPRISATDG